MVLEESLTLEENDEEAHEINNHLPKTHQEHELSPQLVNLSLLAFKRYCHGTHEIIIIGCIYEIHGIQQVENVYTQNGGQQTDRQNVQNALR